MREKHDPEIRRLKRLDRVIACRRRCSTDDPGAGVNEVRGVVHDDCCRRTEPLWISGGRARTQKDDLSTRAILSWLPSRRLRPDRESHQADNN
jgi:hypothetical protein